ncbi:MAG: four helix bundle protein [Fuerstiella sp.]|nr:four helix bundle protein [Fuerstiella sp.]MCP4784124.1 four helix bundle protein [Fuerstiella sp.]MCP4857317.1 four helix bundle protein [Fuerstiella sp.]
MFRFEKPDVWHRAIEFADVVYLATRMFPDDERFRLTGQIRRASASVSSNIAEGCGRISDKGFARFIEIAYGSLMEVTSQAEIAHRHSFRSVEDRNRLKEEAEQLSRMLSGLRIKLLSTS